MTQDNEPTQEAPIAQAPRPKAKACKRHQSKITCICLLVLTGTLLALYGLGLSHHIPIALSYLLIALFSLKKIHQLTRGMWARFLCGIIGTGLIITGFIGFFICGDLFITFVSRGGAAWFAAVTMACCALIGIIVFGVFGYLLLHFMERRLWMATAYFSLILSTLGFYLNQSQGFATRMPLPLTRGEVSMQSISIHNEQGEQQKNLGFNITFNDYQTDTNSILISLTTKRSKEELRLSPSDTIAHQSWQIKLDELYHYPQGDALLITIDYQPGRFLVRGGGIALLLSLLAFLFWGKIGRKKTKCDQQKAQ